MKRTLNFGKIAYNGLGRKINKVSIDIELRGDGESPILSICGAIWNSKETDAVQWGQCLDTIKEYIDTPLFNEVYRLWILYHLNNMYSDRKRGIPSNDLELIEHIILTGDLK